MKKSEEVNESLFICSQSADPFSIRLLHPLSGSARKAFRGAEFQGGIVRTATFLGQGHLCVALADKPILHSIPVRQPQQRGKAGTAAGQFCTKSILASPAHFLAAHPCGDFIFICSDNKMFVWEVHGGQLLCMVEEHVREVSAMRISSCGNFLATASQDGAVKMYLTASLIASRDELNPVRPIGSHAAHSLVVNDLCISPGLNPRILSVSSDHSACLFSLATQKILLRLTTDQPLTACCMDPAETVVLLGSNTGRILKVYIQTDESENNNNFHPMKSPGNDGITGQFEHHESAIKRLCVNLDGTRLASGDQTGSYCIWDIGNGQSLKSGKMPGPINELIFLISSLGTGNDDQQPNTSSSPLVSNLQRNVATTRILKVKKHVESADDQKIPKGTSFPAYFNTLLRNFNEQALRGSTTTSASEEPKQVASNAGNKKRRLEPDIMEPPNEPQQQREQVIDLTETEQKIAGLEREITRLVQVNSELYNFAASLANEEENS